MERPEELAGKSVLTDEEAASFEQAENRRLNRNLIDQEIGGAFYPPESEVSRARSHSPRSLGRIT